MQPVTYSAPRATTTRRRLMSGLGLGFALATLAVAATFLPGKAHAAHACARLQQGSNPTAPALGLPCCFSGDLT